MKNKYLISITAILLCSSVAITGCSSALKQNVRTASAKVASCNPVERELVEAAKSVQNSLALLVRTQEQNHVPLLNTAPLLTPEGGMSGTVDIDWTGPIEPLVSKLADMTEYKVKVLGNAPAIPVIVSIAQNNAVIADILKNAGMQAGKRANIVVFPANRLIELRYAALGSTGG